VTPDVVDRQGRIDQMAAAQTYVREQSLKAEGNSLPLTTLIGVALAVVLTLLALGSALSGAPAQPDEPGALTLIGP
jgi:hypothetical protein